jgi:hypothetical protein
MPTETPLFETLYIRTDLDAEVQILTNVWAWARGVRTIRTGTYRDTGWNVGKLVAHPTNSLSGAATGFLSTIAQEIPVVGKQEVVPEWDSWDAIKHVNTDEVEHIPPRFYQRRESGYLFALTDTAIEEPPPVRTGSHVFTADVATDICTSVDHTFLTGDTVVITTSGAYPGALAAGVFYTVLVLSSSTFFLRTAAGAVVNITSAGSGTHVAVLAEPVDHIPANEEGVVFVPDAWNPRISTVDPRL